MLIDDDTYAQLRATRSKYRLTERGRPDADGFQRFDYPDLTRATCFDPATGKRVKPTLTKKTMTLRAESEAEMKIIKHLQSFEYRSPEWHGWSGLRQHVESNNTFLKDDAHTDLGNATKRRARGFAYQFLTFAVAATVANMRRIVTFLTKAARTVLPTTALRAKSWSRRRKQRSPDQENS